TTRRAAGFPRSACCRDRRPSSSARQSGRPAPAGTGWRSLPVLRVGKAGRFERLGGFFLVGAGMNEPFGLAPAAGEHQQEAFKEQEEYEDKEHADAEGPQSLRDPQRRTQHADI